MSLGRCAALLLPLVFQAAPLPAQESANYFRQYCMSCHTIGGGRLTGPDLKHVTERLENEWLVRFILNPREMIQGGDPYARQIYEESRRVMMPTAPGITEERALALLILIEAESSLEESQFKGLEISDRPFTERDVAAGRAHFTGQADLASGGAACIACHTVRGLEGLGGGRLGPDLTRAYERLGGRANMGAWLFAPATPTMAPLFQEHPLSPEEILTFLAFFEDSARKGGDDDTVALLNFFLLALGAMIVLLVIFDVVWKGRYRSVRAALVQDRTMVR